jgi:hypothetical protein
LDTERTTDGMLVALKKSSGGGDTPTTTSTNASPHDERFVRTRQKSLWSIYAIVDLSHVHRQYI